MSNDPSPSSCLPEFASWDGVVSAIESDDAVRKHALHNLNYWRWVHGGLAMTRKSPVDFDPIQEYWHLSERRMLVTYFCSRFEQCYAPADAMRNLAYSTFLHFDRCRQDGLFGDPVLARPGNWAEIGALLLEAAETLQDFPEYQELRNSWARLKAPSLKADLTAFLMKAIESGDPDSLYLAFYRRISWFPYLGLGSLAGLIERQRFFFGFYELFTSSNSYVQGGAMSFAPVLQNNPTSYLMGFIDRWEQGETPSETGFDVEGRRDRRDMSHVSTVGELFGLLNLHRQPFYNNRTFGFYQEAASRDVTDRFDIMAAVGQDCHSYLVDRPDLVTRFSMEFRRLVDTELPTTLKMEGIALTTVANKLPEEVEHQVEVTLYREIKEASVEKTRSLSDLDAAASYLYLMLDACLYQITIVEPKPPVLDSEVSEVEPTPPPSGDRIELPDTLRFVANDALGFLRAGHHVLFAGPPGTGKTTLAQIVGHAWNQNRNEVSGSILQEEAPVTTVGNSAWAPFHTIGGILPDGKGGFNLQKGIFIAGQEMEPGVWTLRGDCLVLDEMNRADLDRCIGELYPLLSNSVSAVQPAGIPGVQSIRQNPDFRIIATVNDATIDDVVFPISEGLARRFIRIELTGDRMDELENFLMLDQPMNDRSEAAQRMVENLFEILRGDYDLLQITEHGERLPFGVGYFSLLRTWVLGNLRMSSQFEEREPLDQAAHLTSTGLRSAARFRGLDKILEKLQQRESPD